VRHSEQDTGKGNAEAQYSLGLPYKWEYPKETAKRIWNAVDQRYPEAQSDLRLRYRWGDGVPRDFSAGNALLLLAASNSTATESIGNNATNARDGYAAGMTSAQIAEAQRLARECRPEK